ncbi:hypothetical protein R2F25_18230 [Streptomyces sp. UP1A-1]|nr:hypothetical protein [Streptomyces sp. UP1A-1]
MTSSPTSAANSAHQRTSCSRSSSPTARSRPAGTGCGGVSVPRRCRRIRTRVVGTAPVRRCHASAKAAAVRASALT